MTTTQLSRKQRGAIIALSTKAGVAVPENLDEFSRGEASELISELASVVDGDAGSASSEEQATLGKHASVNSRIRMCLCAKLVYRRMSLAGEDPLDGDVETFKANVRRLDAVLGELEGGA